MQMKQSSSSVGAVISFWPNPYACKEIKINFLVCKCKSTLEVYNNTEKINTSLSFSESLFRYPKLTEKFRMSDEKLLKGVIPFCFCCFQRSCSFGLFVKQNLGQRKLSGGTFVT